ncbi:serine hydrolase [Novosphingobium sp. FKTRR1]|uniref:serine hydrolase domain-containing protein n=1 Tax=Novosphingobium sp. FKTRR1 TaxID=2879118 RepID=UPI001CF0736D|nr:serine hydrolase domain-containing protein [Novosphingobium sp. FKTRR1]
MRRLFATLGLVWALFASTIVDANPQAPSLQSTSAPAGQLPAAHPLNTADAEAWLDGFMPAELARGEIAGAVVVVVKDGQVMLEKGYGTSDVATGAPVDPKRTGFRPGSVSKLFTWTAVMQLVEQGKLSLDADVNSYLDFKIPPRGGKPITLRNCMTHTPGFEEAVKDLIDAHPRDTSLGNWLKRWTPTRVFDAGTTPAYSNYCAALSGYIVARVSGEPFDAYVDQHILKPLDMNNSSFAVPMPKRILDTMSKGYQDATKRAQPFEIVVASPAGNLAATGEDMAHFMIAHLQNGKYGNTQILKPETAQMMHNTTTRLMPPLNGIELGMMVSDLNGHRIIGHGGDTAFFHSGLYLFINDNVGLFVSVNSAGVKGAGSLRGMLVSGFADRYFPAPNTDGKVDAATAAEHARMVSGSYISARGGFSNFLALMGVVGQLKVVTNPDGTVSFPLIPKPSGEPIHYREIAPFVWRDIAGHERFGAMVKGGKVVRVSSDTVAGIAVYDRAPWYLDAAWLIPATVTGFVVVLLTALGWPVLALVRRSYGARLALVGKRARAYRLVRLGAVAAVAGAGALIGMFSIITGDGGFEWLGNNNWALLLVELIVLIGSVGGLVAALYNLFAVLTGKSSWIAKLWAAALSVSFLMLAWFAWAGGLLTFTTNY